MSAPQSPSPQPKVSAQWQPQSQLPDLSVLSTPSFDASLPLPRPISSSGMFRRSSLAKNSRLASSQRRRRTRSVASTGSHSSDGSLGDFSMENYTIDIAQLGKDAGAVRPIGYEKAFQNRSDEAGASQKKHEGVDEEDEVDEDEVGDLMRGYEVDLGGLGDKPSSVVVEDAVQLRDEVPSDDEGPDDFTQNMEMWMRGNKKWEKERDEDIAEGREPDPDPEVELRQAMADNGAPEESVFEPLGTSTPAPQSNHIIIQKGVDEEAKAQAPPLTRLNTEMVQNQAAEEVFDRISALQAEVESLRADGEARLTSHQVLQKEHKDLIAKYETAEEHHRTEHEVLRAECARLNTIHAGTTDSLRRENKDLTQEYNSAMEQIRLLERQVQEPKDQSLQAKYNELTQELGATKAAIESERISARSEIESLRQELETARGELTVSRDKMQSMQESQRLEIDQLKTDVEARQKEVALERKESIYRANEAASLADSLHEKEQKIREQGDEVKAVENELNHALEQLTETRRIVETVEDENDRLEQQNERQAANIVDLKASIKSQEVPEPKVAAANETPTSMIDEATHKAVLDALAQQHQSTVSSLRADHDRELQTLHNAFQKAKEESEKRVKRLGKTHANEITSLNHQLTSLKSQTPKLPAAPPSTPTEEDLRSAIRVLNTKLSKANASVAAALTEAEAARQETQDALQTNAIVNSELEARFAEAVESRESEWRRRVELLFRERERMGKALLWGWGREDFGPMDGEQAYRYRYAKSKRVS